MLGIFMQHLLAILLWVEACLDAFRVSIRLPSSFIKELESLRVLQFFDKCCHFFYILEV